MSGRRKRFIDNSILVVPNLFTTVNLFCGFYSIVASLKGDFIFASYLILAAAVFDMVDGRVARWANGGTDFGREYDSLCDLVSFGVAPVVLAYLHYLSFIPKIGWIVAFLYVACGALRLAKFNVCCTNADPKYFNGLPIPVAAVVVVSGFLFFNRLVFSPYDQYYFMLLLILVSILMVSSIKYKSYKKPEKTVRKGVYTNTILFLLLLVVVATNPDIILFILAFIYLLQGMFMELYKFVGVTLRKNRDKKRS